MELLKATIKFAVISIAIYLSIKRELIEVEILHSFDIAAIMSETLRLVVKMLIIISIVMFFIAIIDYLFQRHEYLKNLRMSREEIKEEYKQTEGSPEIKSKLKALRHERSRKRMMAAVPTADVVITNPTHYSIALKYDHDAMSAPKVVAKGKDLIALKIREIAVNNFIPIIENPPLARSLFASTKVDDFIPYEHYKAVAEIMAYVMRHKKKKF
jgi:flagellar biosynthetic protein FlhB